MVVPSQQPRHRSNLVNWQARTPCQAKGATRRAGDGLAKSADYVFKSQGEKRLYKVEMFVLHASNQNCQSHAGNGAKASRFEASD